MPNSPPNAPADPRLILSEDELDRALETFFLAEAALWRAADAQLEQSSLGRGHYRAAFLLKRRPGLGVQELARLTGLSKQGASKALKELIASGLAEAATGELDARRRPTRLTGAGHAFESSVSASLRERLASAYREGGIDAAPGARRILAALAGPRATQSRRKDEY
jgi:DNA-binding MarR family transcriptional regulator